MMPKFRLHTRSSGMADPTTHALGVVEPPEIALRRKLIEAGLDPELAVVRP